MATRSTYPVHVAAELEPGLSRWVWLVKWLLVIPHYVVLFFLWAALVVTSVVALVAILVTGRYPRAIFEFNVGVLRWSWRVSYYSYGALGTDRYPPFTLHDVPDYPAHLEVDYPERLSRGLALVKWILAIPHYLVLGLLLGGVGWTVEQENAAAGGVGLIAILVLVAGVLLLFTGRYPTGLFDLILGLNRWVLRVAGYVALMTDRYPPFRLDQGGADGSRAGDPGGDGGDNPLTDDVSVTVPDQPSQAGGAAAAGGPARPPARHEVRTGWSPGRVLMLTLGSVLVLGAAGLGIAAGAVALVAGSSRDGNGFVTSPTQPLSSPTYAITSGDLHLRTDVPSLPGALVGKTRLTTTSADGEEVFLGVARTDDVRAYLVDVERAQLRAIRSGDPIYEVEPGGAPRTPPTEEDFWLVETAGSGHQAITWTPENGDWTAVVMNVDGSRGVDVEVTAGAELPVLRGLTAGMGVLAGVALVGGALLVAAALRSASRDGRPSP